MMVCFYSTLRCKRQINLPFLTCLSSYVKQKKEQMIQRDTKKEREKQQLPDWSVAIILTYTNTNSTAGMRNNCMQGNTLI